MCADYRWALWPGGNSGGADSGLGVKSAMSFSLHAPGLGQPQPSNLQKSEDRERANQVLLCPSPTLTLLGEVIISRQQNSAGELQKRRAWVWIWWSESFGSLHACCRITVATRKTAWICLACSCIWTCSSTVFSPFVYCAHICGYCGSWEGWSSWPFFHDVDARIMKVNPCIDRESRSTMPLLRSFYLNNSGIVACHFSRWQRHARHVLDGSHAHKQRVCENYEGQHLLIMDPSPV